MQLRAHQQRALDAMLTANKGQILVPTGGGKTLIAIKDVERRLDNATTPQTIVVVAPRIMLATQLSSEYIEVLNRPNLHVMHVHSGETHHFSTTKVDKIQLFSGVARTAGEHCIIFTTYHSLPRIIDSGIDIDCCYFDEAHNAVQRHHFVGVAAASMSSIASYFFTATPKHTIKTNRGMNNAEIYGNVLCNVPAPELIQSGSILPPTISPYQVDFVRQKGTDAAESDRQMILDIVDSLDAAAGSKVLVASPASKVMGRLLFETDIMAELTKRGYDILHITSKFGAYVNKTKVNREQFFDTFDMWGKDPNKKFIIFHYSILSEGINVHGLTHCIMLRNLNIIEMAQTIGRVIRMNRDDAADIATGKIPAGQCHLYRKSTGYISVPVFKNYGAQTIKRLQRIVDTVFVDGQPATSVVS
ncbi:Helicase [Synechococcus phage S-PM2]|uniref:Helicase n=1 Tax=Synechococcus phage S-PM2 TaxID=238854 RepID=Q5GQA5_BPSYP|nr:Helicase [Synechococcus phage S-PM2]CAF34297.1 Helicase [Synechococcus phage S-PM2]CFW42474.1 Helicase [Synechococcus phage S-PM2]